MEFNTVKEFANYVAEHLFDAREDLADNKVVVNEVVKNNGMVLQGLTIKSESSNIAPTIYVNDFYNRYMDGLSVDEVISRIVAIFVDHRVPENISVDFFTDFEQVKDRLAMKVINAEKNVELLAACPHFIMGDLAAIFQVQVDSNEFGNAVITVKNEHSNMWGVDAQTLMNLARENMEEKQPVRIQSMLEVLRDMMGGDMPDEMLSGPEPAMYVMSNESKVNGAAAMVFTDKLQEFAELHETNFFILPSSIHETLLVPDNGEMDVEQLTNMVREVNDTQVAPDEILSYTVYYYDRDAQALMFAENKEVITIHEV